MEEEELVPQVEEVEEEDNTSLSKEKLREAKVMYRPWYFLYCNFCVHLGSRISN